MSAIRAFCTMLKSTANKLLRAKAARYLVSGGTAFSLEYVAFLFLFYIVSAPSVAANTVSFMIGFVVSFGLNKLWVFHGDQGKKTQHQIGLYFALALVNLAITNIAILWLIEVGTPGYAAKIVLIGCVAVWNFILFSKLIFNRSKRS